MKYSVILFSWLFVFWVPQLLQPFYPAGPMWYFTNSLWSIVLLNVLLLVERSSLTLTLTLLEIGSLILHLLACAGVVYGATYLSFFHNHYKFLLLLINLLEGLVLIYKAPYNDGLIKLFNKLCRVVSDFSSVSKRFVQLPKG